MTPRETWNAFETLSRRERIRFLRIWPQTLFPPVVTQTLYFLIFGKFIGAQIRDIHGISYMAFIVPGLVMMSVINSSFSNVVSSFFSSKFQRNIEEMLISPMPNWVIVLGFASGGVMRGILVGTLVFGVSIFFTQPEIHHAGVILSFTLLTAVVFSLGGMLNGILAKKYDDVSIFPIFVLTPLVYLGGVFYSVNHLPGIWQTVSKLNPVLYMVNGFRYGFYGVSDVPLGLSFLLLGVCVILLGSINLLLLNRGTGLKS